MPKSPRARVTMEDVAKLAGVAKITVSRALQDSPLVRPELRDRVKEVAREQGYRLNTTARNLRLQRTHSVMAVIETEPGGERSVGEPLVQMAIGGLLSELAQARYQLVLTTHSVLDVGGAIDVDGIVVMGQGANGESTRRLRQYGLPMITWGTPLDPHDDAIFVCSDNFEGGRLIGQHLLELGRRKIVYLGDPAHPEIGERVRGIRHALGRKGKLFIVPCAFTRTAGRAAMIDALSRFDDIDGVAAASDMIALGARAVLSEAGKHVPRDIALIGYDDTASGAGLTSVRQEWVRAGAVIATKILQVINGEKVKSEQLPVELVVRGSTVPATRRLKS